MADELFSVEDQVVLVSGGSRGIGAAIAQGFAERGAQVIITGRNPETLEQAAGEMSGGKHPVVGVVCDVADDAAIDQAVAQVIADHKHIDTLINVAGINKRMPSEEYTRAEFDEIMNTNFRGAAQLSLAVGKHMLERAQGNQINIVSLNNYAPLKHVLPYAASKAALGHMTRSLAMEWGPRGVRVNAIAPGFILTDLTKKLWAREDVHAWGMANTPQKRLGSPEDMVGTAIFLASDASAFMTGQILFVDGGFSAGMIWPIEG